MLLPKFIRAEREKKRRDGCRVSGKVKLKESLEGVAERKLNQARHALGAGDYTKVARAFDVGGNRVGKVYVVPDVEEIRGEADALALGNTEILDQREIPVLLFRTTVDIAAEVTEARGAEIGVRRSSGIRLRGIA